MDPKLTCCLFVSTIVLSTSLWMQLMQHQSLAIQTRSMYFPFVFSLIYTDNVRVLLKRVIGCGKRGDKTGVMYIHMMAELAEEGMDPKLTCILFVSSMVLSTSLWMQLTQHQSLTIRARCMYFPFVFSLIYTKNLLVFVKRVIGCGKAKESAIWSLWSAILVPVTIGTIAAVDLLTGWAVINPTGKTFNMRMFTDYFVWGFVRAAGEEIGWRSFLLPLLMANFPPFRALLISGVSWGLFHLPVMISLTSKYNVPNPAITVGAQMLACIAQAYPHGWVAVKSGYSMWASTAMHCIWNIINPVILGSIYTQSPGILIGKQWLINGEGLAGMIVSLLIAIFITKNLERRQTENIEQQIYTCV